VRLLIRTAQPVDVAPVQFMASEGREQRHA
jgi:hypothetical protein